MPLPNFLIVGAAKAGTTAIYEYIKQHPDIYMPDKIKEPTFLSGLTREDLAHWNADYLTHMMVFNFDDYIDLFNEAAGIKAIGEASVSYLFFYASTIPRIQNILGKDVKIIISLRNPVDRMFSQYTHLLRDGFETRSFDEALATAKKKTRKAWWNDLDLQVSCYADQVKAYIDAFGKENVHIIIYDDLVRDQQRVIASIFDFLEVDSTFRPDISKKYNVTGVPKSKIIYTLFNRRHPVKEVLKLFVPAALRRSIRNSQIVNQLIRRNLKKPQIPPATRTALVQYFQDDINQLQPIIERDLSLWRQDV